MSSMGPSISVSGVRNSWLREERRLGAVELRECFRLTAFVFVSLRARQRRCDLAGREAEEAPVSFIHEPERIKPHDENAKSARLARRRYGQDSGECRGLLPGAGRKWLV